MKTAYIVQGVGESTGCRFLTSLLIDAGVYGSSKHSQEFQNFMYNDEKFAKQIRLKNLKSLVVRQSYPHGRSLPSLHGWYNRLTKAGFDKVYTILTMRSQPAQIISTDKNGHCENSFIKEYPLSINRLQKAYKHIFSDLNKINNGEYEDFVCLNLGDLSSHPVDMISYVFNFINIKVPTEDYILNKVKKNIDNIRLSEYKVVYGK